MYKSLTNLFDVTLGYEDITFSINDTMLKLLHRKNIVIIWLVWWKEMGANPQAYLEMSNSGGPWSLTHFIKH